MGQGESGQNKGQGRQINIIKDQPGQARHQGQGAQAHRVAPEGKPGQGNACPGKDLIVHQAADQRANQADGLIRSVRAHPHQLFRDKDALTDGDQGGKGGKQQKSKGQQGAQRGTPALPPEGPGQQQAGDHEVVFQVNRLGFGTYFYRLQAGDNVETKKMILLP